jgi:hypothetical protein
MPTKTADATTAITDVFVSSLKQSQELAASSLNAWVDFAGKSFAMPSLDSLPAGFPAVDARELVDLTFSFAEEVLATQKAIAGKFVDALAPLAPKSA